MVSSSRKLALWMRPAVFLGQNKLSLTGAILTTSSAVTLVFFWIFELLKERPLPPYAGILLFLILPGIFVFGLAMIPAGMFLERRSRKSKGELPSIYPELNFKTPGVRRSAIVVGVLTAVNVGILGAASYRGVEFMDSADFCGKVCHSVMAPEYAAYQDSPHSRVACVSCHIGPGASWFVQSKLSGTRQVFAVTFKTYSRPIPSPVHELRPARETCEQCHWPEKFHGDKFVVKTRFSDDEANTRLTTVIVLRVGGKSAAGVTGIHGRHLDAGSRIQYVSIDGRRQVIPTVSYLDDSGKKVDYVSADVKATPEQLAKGEHRSMDCLDCHNRPSHAFQLPERGVDAAMAEGKISPTLPFVKKKAVEFLRVEYPDRETAKRKIGESLTDYYQKTYPEVYRQHRALVEAAVSQVQAIYLRNVFPEMKLTWGTHPNQIGHEDFLGCFRCHDGNHKTADGKEISQDCDSCHAILAQDESDPKVLEKLGLK
jgi:nitrate/TMAO reductase-like tetraheme cytochrome c subunit